jgi:hypothetical protein
MSVFSHVIVKIFSLVIGFLVEIFKERRFCDANERFGGLRLTGRLSAVMPFRLKEIPNEQYGS